MTEFCMFLSNHIYLYVHSYIHCVYRILFLFALDYKHSHMVVFILSSIILMVA